MSKLSPASIASRLFDTPLLLAPAKVNAIAWALRDRLEIEAAEPDAAAIQAAGTGAWGAGAWDKQRGYFVDGGVAIIPVTGTLVTRGGYMDAASGLTSYEALAGKLDKAKADSRIRSILLDIDSYGGEASGVDDLAAQIRALDQSKPVYAMIDGYGASAAYWIAAAARKVWIANSSHGGSIGVALTHMDHSGAAEKAGMVVTHIYAGADKTLGSPWRALSDTDREKLQARVDSVYAAFVSAVADYRSLKPEAVRQTEAGLFTGPEMVAHGLADGVTTGRNLLAALRINGRAPNVKLTERRAPEKKALSMVSPTTCQFEQLDSRDIYSRRRQQAVAKPAGPVELGSVAAVLPDPDQVYARRRRGSSDQAAAAD